MEQPNLLWRGEEQLRLSKMLSSRRKIWLLACLLGQLTAIASIGLLALSGWFLTAAGLAGMISLSTAYTFNYFTPAGIIRLLAILRTAGRYGERLVSHNAVLGLLADLRTSMFARLAAIQGQKPASIKQMHRLISDIDLLNGWPLNVVLPWCWSVVVLVLITVWNFCAGGILLAVMVLIPLLFACIIIPILAAKYGCHFAMMQAEQVEQRREALLQPLTALTALLQWQQWTRFVNQFHSADQQYISSQLQQQKTANKVVLIQQLCLVLAAALLLCQGGNLIISGQMTVSMLLALLLMILGFTELVIVLGRNMLAYGLCRAACQRLNELVNVEVQEKFTGISLPSEIHIKADKLCACWPEALNGADDISFDLFNGNILFIQGPSGIGKSTLLSVLANELPISSGKLLCNNQPFADWQWQGEIAYLSQQLDIFDLTLAENLRLGKPDASTEELWTVLDQVCLADWARAQPQGLDTQLGEYGAAVSGGQARRIALARLLLRPYLLMLLDEPFAGIDENTSAYIAQILRKKQENGILIVASHQRNPWKQAQILKLG